MRLAVAILAGCVLVPGVLLVVGRRQAGTAPITIQRNVVPLPAPRSAPEAPRIAHLPPEDIVLPPTPPDYPVPIDAESSPAPAARGPDPEPESVVAAERQEMRPPSRSRRVVPPAQTFDERSAPAAPDAPEVSPARPQRRGVRAREPVAPPELEISPAPPVAADLIGVCLLCGAPADSFTVVDDQKVGYCRKHLGKAALPSGPDAKDEEERAERGDEGQGAAPPALADRGPAPQCRALTRARTRCRRKTRDPSGLCYQHKRR